MDTIIALEKFLENKTLFYDKIDYDVIAKSWEVLSSHVKLPYVIHIVGTNGKGSTGRFIASFLHQLNQNVLHYTSPHIIKFNERIWINGKDVDNITLENAHKGIYKMLSKEYLDKLTYFEYTTLLALYLSNDMDYVVLEAGLGGEFDATNVVINDMTVVPSIGLDHMEFLGNSIEDIAVTKLRSCNKRYILGKSVDKNIISLSKTLLGNKEFINFNTKLTLENCVTMPKYLYENLQLALNVIDYLDFENKNLIVNTIKGRCEKIESNITIDVGHNPLAATVLLEEFRGKKVILVYNSFKDKDFKTVLTILKPIISKILLIECSDERIVEKETLFLEAQKLSIEVDEFNIETMNTDDEYLVFGSFLVVEEFLKQKAKFEK
jgi:dihydrofolate synthase/folylpolyglutamate synthase